MAQQKPDQIIFEALCDTMSFGRRGAEVITRGEAEDEVWYQTQHILDRLNAEGYLITNNKRKGNGGGASRT